MICMALKWILLDLLDEQGYYVEVAENGYSGYVRPMRMALNFGRRNKIIAKMLLEKGVCVSY